jgi:hypothetical protein
MTGEEQPQGTNDMATKRSLKNVKGASKALPAITYISGEGITREAIPDAAAGKVPILAHHARHVCAVHTAHDT